MFGLDVRERTCHLVINAREDFAGGQCLADGTDICGTIGCRNYVDSKNLSSVLNPLAEVVHALTFGAT